MEHCSCHLMSPFCYLPQPGFGVEEL
jgi:hypothetical protein